MPTPRASRSIHPRSLVLATYACADEADGLTPVCDDAGGPVGGSAGAQAAFRTGSKDCFTLLVAPSSGGAGGGNAGGADGGVGGAAGTGGADAAGAAGAGGA